MFLSRPCRILFHQVTTGAWRRLALALTQSSWHRVAGTSGWCSGRCRYVEGRPERDLGPGGDNPHPSAPERLFHFPHCPCPHLASKTPLHLAAATSPATPALCASRSLPVRVMWPGLPSPPLKDQSGQMLRHLGGHRDSVQSSDFAPSSDCLATGSWDSAICIWDLRTGTPVTSHQELEGHSGNISCLCYSASGLLASGSWDKTIHIWKPSTRNLLVQLKGHVTWVKSIAFSPDGSQLASAGYSHMVKVWDCNTGKCMETLKVSKVHGCSTQGCRKRPARGGWGQAGLAFPEPSEVLSAGSPGCGPRLCLHPRWETLSVWSC
ncbi:WD repeat-containing protein 38 isoform X2 [Felis catus]|uniref:WD repeat-containing protein 38 isoform X2 n=1 Tax=Felis catus TaxID=9685 RepID=UPI001D19CE16|nr:WD repeat-containing protein 38 isoform X2 [Felis catus]